MSNTVTAHRPQRKQLSDQLDRLDGLIDCLADQLPHAVADATRDGTRQAVRDVLAELLADPRVVARLRAALLPEPAVGITEREQKPGAFARLKSAVRAGVTRVNGTVKAVADRVKNAVAATRVRVTNAATTTLVRVRTTVSRITTACQSAVLLLLAWQATLHEKMKRGRFAGRAEASLSGAQLSEMAGRPLRTVRHALSRLVAGDRIRKGEVAAGRKNTYALPFLSRERGGQGLQSGTT
jgi:hypothetical protein